MTKAGTFLGWIGGGLARVTAGGLVTGVIMIATGLNPGQAVAYLWSNPPPFLLSPWFGPVLVILGLVVIGLSLFFNVWSLKQKAIDDLAEDISDAISDLVNRKPPPGTLTEVKKWDEDYLAWCGRVSEKLGNRAFFTRADQLHFDRLGYLDSVRMGTAQNTAMNWRHSKLRLKLHRLREVINWTQQRRR